ncbi:MAG: hypothetical protein ACSLE0_09160 [Chitinophagaceae bacterium]
MENKEKINEPAPENGKQGLEKNERNKSSFFHFIKKHPVIFTALIGIIAVVAVYLWKDRESVLQLEKVEKLATTQIMQNNQEMLKLIAKPLIWSIRAEMMRGNMEQVNIFTTDLVREKNFQFIYLIEPGGNIIISTDKKLEGQTAIGMFDAKLVQTDSVIVEVRGDDLLTLAAPVMGYDKKLAILVINYAPQKFISGKSGESK